MNSNKYPFLTKSDITARIAQDDVYVVEALQILQHRQTSDEEEAKTTKYRNARGWMSSHAKRGTELAAKAQTEGLTGQELEEVRALVGRYTKQLANHHREVAIRENPELATEAACFFK